MSELKPCPFCGQPVEITHSALTGYHIEHKVYNRFCVMSEGLLRKWKTFGGLTGGWNTRAETEAEKKIEEVRAECARRLALHRGMNESMMAIEDHAYYRILDILEGEK